jgi:hypothetical protein
VVVFWQSLSCLRFSFNSFFFGGGGWFVVPLCALHTTAPLSVPGPSDELLCSLVGDNVKTFHLFCYD